MRGGLMQLWPRTQHPIQKEYVYLNASNNLDRCTILRTIGRNETQNFAARFSRRSRGPDARG